MSLKSNYGLFIFLNVAIKAAIHLFASSKECTQREKDLIKIVKVTICDYFAYEIRIYLY